MVIKDLDQVRAFALIGEMTSTRNLLGYGVKALRGARFLETTLDPIMTMLSIGTEKLLKLTVGVISLDEHREWPSKATMMQFGHGIVELFDTAMVAIRERTKDKSDYVRGLVAGVDADPVLRPLLEALDRYGSSGRFYNLDKLAQSPQSGMAPDAMWDVAEQAALRDPRVAALYEHAMSNVGDNDAWEAVYAAVQARVAESVERLLEMVSRVGINHALGETGADFGWQVNLDSVGRQ